MKSISLLGLWFVLASSAMGQGKLFIIGGGSRPDAMVERMIAESGIQSGGYGIILPMSSASDSAVIYANEQFLSRKIKSVRGLTFKKGEVPSKAKLDSVRSARIIYITGGDQNRFMDIVRGTEIEKAILEAHKRGGLIAGTSAGAAVMSKIMITGNERKHSDYASTFKNIEAENIETNSGLGLIQGVIIDQHFLKRSRHNRLLSALIEFPDQVGIGIDEATAVLVKGETFEVVGDNQVLIIRNPQRSKNVINGRLGARNLSMDIYLPGETFQLTAPKAAPLPTVEAIK